MKQHITVFAILILALGLCNEPAAGQTRTVGLFRNDSAQVFKGYTLFAPKQNTMTYLINNEGRIVHQWTASKFPASQCIFSRTEICCAPA